MFSVDLIMPFLAFSPLARQNPVGEQVCSYLLHLLVSFDQAHFHSLCLLWHWHFEEQCPSPSSLLSRMFLILFVWYFLMIRGNIASPPRMVYEWRWVLLGSHIWSSGISLCPSLVVLILFWSPAQGGVWFPHCIVMIFFFETKEQPVGICFKTTWIFCFSSKFPLDLASTDDSCLDQSLL